MSRPAPTAGTGGSPTTPAGTGIARDARAQRRGRSSPSEVDLLLVGYFHVVFTLPFEVADIAWQNKAMVYGLLFQAASETMTTIVADPQHLGARIGITAVLHMWGSAMTHHQHIHMIVPGGGLSPDGTRFLLHVLPRSHSNDASHRRNLGLLRPRASTASATTACSPAPPARHLERVRELLGVAPPTAPDASVEPDDIRPPCPCCGGRMVVVETFERQGQPRAPSAHTLLSRVQAL